MCKKDIIQAQPIIHEKSFVHPSAELWGEVEIEDGVIIAPHVSIRADEGRPFRICKGTNVQDGVIMHGLWEKYITVNDVNYSIYVGSHCSIAHGALIHGPTAIGKKTFIGFNAIIHSANIYRNCFIDHGAQVIDVMLPPNSYVPKGWVIDSQERVKELPPMPEKAKAFNPQVVDRNKELVLMYKAQIIP